MSLEQPVLSLGMAGFTPVQRDSLNRLLSRLPGGLPIWRSRAEFTQADAWLVSGENSRVLRAGGLTVLPAQAGERILQLNLAEVDRPIAFSLPLTSAELDPMHTFDPASEASLRQVLGQFETWMRPLRAHFVLGGQLIARESELLPGIYHVSHQGRLLAIMDFYEWRIGIAPTADPAELGQARWARRPPEANDIPSHFRRSSLQQLRWIYTQRTERDVLPLRYRSQLIYFRQAPAVPMRWLQDGQLLLLRELSVGPATLDHLQQRTGLPQGQLARDLAGLYFAGAVTTTATKAGQAAFGRPSDSGPVTGPGHSEPASQREPERAYPTHASELTAPAQLGLK